MIMILFFVVLIFVALTDMKTMEIPNKYIIAILILGAVSAAVIQDRPVIDRLIGMACVSLPLMMVTYLIPDAFGGGDIKLMGACGLLLGWKLSLIAFFLAIMTGGSYGIYLLLSGRKGRKEHFAFGPFLCAGMAASVLWGEALLAWYLSLCGF